MKDLTASGLSTAALCFLKAVEVLDELARIKIVGQAQYGRPVYADGYYKQAIILYNTAADKYRAAGLRYAESDFEGGVRLAKEAKSLSVAAECDYELGYKASTGG